MKKITYIINLVTQKLSHGVAIVMIWLGFIALIAAIFFCILSATSSDVDGFDYFALGLTLARICLFGEAIGGLMLWCSHKLRWTMKYERE